jgi:hypothetical protein
MAMHAMHRYFGLQMFTSLAKAAFVVLGLVVLGYFAVVADGNSRFSHGGFSGHAAAGQAFYGNSAGGPADLQSHGVAMTPVPPAAQWDVSPYVNPTAKIAEPIDTF